MAQIHLTIHRHGERDEPTVDFETVRQIVAAIEGLGFHVEMTDTGAIVFQRADNRTASTSGRG